MSFRPRRLPVAAYFCGMNRFYTTLLILALLTACESRKTTDATQTNDTAQTQPAEGGTSATAAPLSPRLQALGLTPDHDWQTVTLGDDFAAAKANTKADPFEQDGQHVGYSTEFDNLESIDYQYFQEKGKVSRIQVDLYLNTAASAAAYLQDLTTYLTTRYGQPTKTGKTTTWQAGKAELKDVSKGKDFGLRLVIK